MPRNAGKLRANYDVGEGSVSFTVEFLDGPSLLRADLLQDWIYDLISAYNDARKEMGWKNVSLFYEEGDDE